MEATRRDLLTSGVAAAATLRAGLASMLLCGAARAGGGSFGDDDQDEDAGAPILGFVRDEKSRHAYISTRIVTMSPLFLRSVYHQGRHHCVGLGLRCGEGGGESSKSGS